MLDTRERILDAWERGFGRPAAERALLMRSITAADRLPNAADPLFAHDRELVALRIALLGPEIDAVVRCPGCGTDFDAPLDLASLELDMAEPRAVTVESHGFAATVRPPSIGDLSRLLRHPDRETLAAALFECCVEQATHRGRAIEPAALPLAIRQAASAALVEQGMESPCLDVDCGLCGTAWRAPVDIAGMLLGDIDDWARRELEEVHRIASAYHWSERDILALSPARRRFYLEAIG